jgi:hypothetical protein
VSSLRNWHYGNACISREEMEFLDHREDLICISPPDEDLVSWLERFVSEKLLRLSKVGAYYYITRHIHVGLMALQRFRSNVSRDQRVHIFTRDSTNLVARAVLTPLIILLVLVPVIICNALNSLNIRLAIMVVATSVFVTLLSLLGKAKTIDLAWRVQRKENNHLRRVMIGIN